MLDLHVAGNTLGAGLVFLFLEFGRHGELALLLLCLVLEFKDRAILDQSTFAGALLDSTVENIAFPSFDEVCVVSAAGRVAVCEDELSSHILEGVGVPDGFIEERDHSVLEALGALAIFDQGGVCDMGSVVIGVKVFTVPARWEHDFEANTVNAVLVEERLVREGVAVQGWFSLGIIVQAVKAKGLLAKSKLGDRIARPGGLRRVGEGTSEVTLVLVSSKHAQSLGERLGVVSIEKVVAEWLR